MYKITQGCKVLEEIIAGDNDLLSIWYWEREGEYCVNHLLFDDKGKAQNVADYLFADIEEV